MVKKLVTNMQLGTRHLTTANEANKTNKVATFELLWQLRSNCYCVQIQVFVDIAFRNICRVGKINLSPQSAHYCTA